MSTRKNPRMNTKRNQSARAAALQVSVFIALMAISVMLFATSFMAGVAPERPIRLAQFYPPLPKAVLPTTPESTLTVSAPVFTMGTGDGFAVNDQPVTTSFVSASLDYIGFQGDLVFDSAVAIPSPTVAPVIPAGLTASGWTVSGIIINSGPGTLKTLRISGFSNDGVTPLSGAGTLLLINWKRVSTNPGDSTSLTWPPYPNDFEYIDLNLNAISPSQNNGLITITTEGTPAPTPTPTPPVQTPIPTQSPTPPPPTATPTPPLPTPTPVPGLRVSAPIFTMGNGDGFVVNNQPVTTTFISPSLTYIGFIGDIIFDSAVALPSPTVAPVAAAGLTAIGWTVSSAVLNTGPGTLKTLRVNAFSNDGETPLSGDGALFVIHWKRVATNPGDSTPLTWGTATNNFRFVDLNLDEHPPSQNNGLIAITVEGTPAPTQTPTPPMATPTATPSPSPTPAGGGTPSPTSTPGAPPFTPSPTPTASPTASVAISGTVTYCSNPTLPPVPNVTITLTGSASGFLLSNSSGNYGFFLPASGSYTVTPTKNAVAPASNGITTVDVIAVQRHFLGITLLTGCRLTAGDVNGDAAISTVDVIAVQRFYLGLTTGTANVGKYQFSPASRSYPAFSGNQTNQDYATVILGDVASSFVAP
jgi:hypothetical protein